ncbi:MAG TPA: GNAT family N-acetyltransferase [Acidimicrobiales bacterium]|jgi:GNAT superfamily N-acetyltransferase|nr:GNAT family N-acetyltransferase [Acidimicrobiales bacterium]
MIWPAGPGDANDLFEIYLLSSQAACGRFLPGVYLQGLEARRDEEVQQWKLSLADSRSPTSTWLAIDDGAATVGFVTVGPARDANVLPDVGEIHALCVHPRWWNAGVGSALLVTAIDQLGLHCYSDAVAWLFEADGRARTFCEKKGWGPDGGRESLDAGGRTAYRVRYRLRLPTPLL